MTRNPVRISKIKFKDGRPDLTILKTTPLPPREQWFVELGSWGHVDIRLYDHDITRADATYMLNQALHAVMFDE